MSGELRRYQSGEALTARRLNEAIDALNGQRQFRAGRGLRASSVGGVVVFELDPSALPRGSGFWAKITTNTGAAHQWVEQELTAPFGWQNKSGGRSSAVSAVAAYEVNGRQKVPADSIVWLDVFNVASGSGPDPESQFALFDLTAGLSDAPHPLEILTDNVASSDTWSVDDQPEGFTGVHEKQLNRIYAGDPDAGKNPAWFSRLFDFDSNGNLWNIAQETADEGVILADVATGLAVNGAGTGLAGTKYKIAVFAKGAGVPFEINLVGMITDVVTALDTDEKVAAQAEHPAGYLIDRLTSSDASVGIALSLDGDDIDLTVAVPDDHKVMISGSDALPDYLASKLAAGAHIQLSTAGAGDPNDETLTIAVTGATVTVVTDVRYDAVTHKFQKKTRSITVLSAEDASDWTDWDSGSQPTSLANVVTDVAWSSPTLSKDRTATVYVLEQGAASNGTTVFSGEECA